MTRSREINKSTKNVGARVSEGTVRCVVEKHTKVLRHNGQAQLVILIGDDRSDAPREM